MKTLDRNSNDNKLADVLPARPTPTAVAHKFGGSSLANAERIKHVAKLIRARSEELQIVVVSAMQGMTDSLIALVHAAATGSQWRPQWEQIRESHFETAQELMGDRAQPTLKWLTIQFEELGQLLHALSVLGIANRDALDRISGLGEVFSSHLLHAYLGIDRDEYALLDARDVLIVRHEELGVAVDWNASATRLSTWRAANPQTRVIVTGYVARDASGHATVLGRNGSDYSGAIFAALFNTHELHIWTDVDGVLTADPRLVPEAIVLDAMSYHEACELAYFGAKVIHPQTMTPAIARGLPILIRNTFNPDHPGTRIDADGDASGPVKGLTLANNMAILNVEGAGMIGVPGTAERVFAALHRARVSVVMISQGSSEHSICCVVRSHEADTANSAITEAFARELAAGQINGVQVTADISVLAAVGDRMAGMPGVAARLFDALARARVNIRAIAQGASERNISVAIGKHDATKALRAAHSAFYLSPQALSLGVIGPGKVGAALLDQLIAAAPRLKREANLDLRLRAVADSKRMWLDDRGEVANWREQLANATAPSNFDAIAAHIQAAHLPHTVIIDCSASDNVAAHYADWLAAGIHVITPNKHAGAGPLERYEAIRAATVSGASRFRYEATVGAGLPVIQTLRDLFDTGDEIYAVEGIFSGTLAWLFNSFDGKVPFSTLVREALDLGYTEPDPRDDLSGTDVARKLVILAREIGWKMSLADVIVENLVPESLRSVERNEFLQRLEELDSAMATRFAQASAKNHVLRYVAHLDRSGKATVGLVELPREHAFSNIRLTDNVVQFSTMRYRDNPLVVQGPGAGPEVTAAGVFADLLRVAASLGARV
jgi:bifunctional aspartokinase / homoserine dehydrogenase 1